MPTVSVTISVDAALLERIDAEARQLREPRSRILARAAEEFLWRRETRELLERLNRAYGSETGPAPLKNSRCRR